MGYEFYVGGEKAFLDFTSGKMSYADIDTAEVHEVEIFVADDVNGDSNGNNDTPGNTEGFLTVGTTYQGCYVLMYIVELQQKDFRVTKQSKKSE